MNTNLKVSLHIVVEGKVYYHSTEQALNTEEEWAKLRARFTSQIATVSLASLERFDSPNKKAY